MDQCVVRVGLAVALLSIGCAEVGPGSDPVRPVTATESFFELDEALTELGTPCDFQSILGVKTMTIIVGNDETAVISKRSADSAMLVNGAPCGTATSATVKVIDITGTTGANTVILDYMQGTFAPGYGTTAGVVVNLGGGTDALKIRGSTGTDRITFGADGISINTDSVRDIVHAGAESWVVSLGSGNDTFSGSGGYGTGAAFASSLTVYGGPGKDSLTGGIGADVLYGGEGDDTLAGASDAALDNVTDNLTGGAGDDVFAAGNASNGGDRFVGNGGDDTVSYADRTNPIVVTMGAGSDDGEASENDTIESDIEIVVGGSGDDLLIGSDGDDVINGSDGDDNITGGLGNDTLNGDAGADRFVATAGDDNDTVSGGKGIDTMDYSTRTGALTVDLDNSPDDGETGEQDNIRTDVENLIGGSGNDTLTGSSQDNVIDGRGGDDTLNGGAGDDWFPQGASEDGADAINGGSGTDTVDYGLRSATVYLDLNDQIAADGGSGGTEGDNLGLDLEDVIGTSAVDYITGNDNDNYIISGAGTDYVDGGPGNDVLFGGEGVDYLNGEEGDDLLDGGAAVDYLDCGDGQGDIVIGDASDYISFCEL